MFSECTYPRPLSPGALKASLIRRNWSISNLAFRWRLTLSQLSRILHDPERAPHYEDAFRGLPALTRPEARALTLLRLKSQPQKRRTRSNRPRTTIEVIHEADDLFMSTDLVDIVLVYNVKNGSHRRRVHDEKASALTFRLISPP